jgi:hypothetical protein
MPSNALDPSWMMVVQRAFADGWQFGRDIIFTYGPLGFITVPQFYPGLYGIALGFWLLFYGAFAAGFCLLYRTASAAKLALLLAVSVLVTLSWAHDGPWFASCLVLFLLARKGERGSTAVAGILAALLATAALIKTSCLFLALPSMILADIARYRRNKALPLFTPVFGAAFTIAYVAAGQSLVSLGAYFVSAFEISRGYGEAMQTYGSLAELAIFAFAAGIFCLAVVRTEFARRPTPDALLMTAMLTGFLFVIAKTGFVRHDVGHAMIPWTALTLAALAYLGEASNERRASISAMLLTAIIALGATFVCLTYVAGARETARTAPAAEILAGDLTAEIRDDATTIANVLFGDQLARFDAAYQAQLAQIRSQNPLPPLGGTADIFGVKQAIMAAGAEYRPRPIFQGYSVYTPYLIELNRASVTGPLAPETIVFDIATVDGRYPALDEGALWPDLLRAYDTVAFINGHAILKRRATPRSVRLDDLHAGNIRFGQEMDVSSWVDGLLWLEMDFQPTFFGRVRSFLFKPPLLMITVTTDAGNTQRFRVVPGMTGSGFLLSPLIESADQFALLPEREEKVTRFSVTAVGRPAGAFDDTIAVRLKRLSIAGENERPATLDMEALAGLRTLRSLAATAGAVPGQAKPQILPDGKALAHAPSRLSLPVPIGATEITLGYGILDGAWADGHETDGACFRVSAGETVLHEACLDPKRVQDDRAMKTVNVILPAGAARISFETHIRDNEDWDWTYWSGVNFK